MPHFLSRPPSLLHEHEIMISEWRDYKLLFSRVAIRHATVNKSLNHCSSGAWSEDHPKAITPDGALG